MLDTTKDAGRGQVCLYRRLDHLRVSGYIQAQYQGKAQTDGCITYASGDSVMLTAPYYSTTPNFLPRTGSPALTGANYTGMNAFFTVGTFRGAMGTTNWTMGWTEWDPQNKAY
ncbi:MAG: hypothetical protein FJX89_04365 [Bacteroidetes bacterium]|nr:hypothetical protein [Bacteroidota bacterium]